MIYTVILSNPDHPEYGVVSVPLPIPTDQYDEIIGMLSQIEVGDPLNHDCKLDEVRGDFSVLKHMENTRVNADELDYLAKRLDSFDAYEKTQFEGMAYRLGLCSTDELINLTFCCQEVTVVTDFNDLEALGRRHFLTLGNGALLSEIQDKDFLKVALAMLESEVGRVTPYGVVFDNGFEMAELYDGRNFPEYRYKDCLMEVEMSSKTAPLDSSETYLYLPMTQTQIERTMLRAGIDNLGEMSLRVIENGLPESIYALLDFNSENIGMLNEMCAAIEKMDKADCEKLCATAEFARPQSAAQIAHLAEQLDLFDFAPNAKTQEDYGRYMILESGHYEFDENLADFYDFEKYGFEHMNSEYGAFTDYGYIAYHGTLSVDELMFGSPGERQEMQMGYM